MNNENGKFFVGPRYEYDNKTGLSHFILSTVEKNSTKVLQLHGLLSELPEITFNINYEDGPANEWQDILSKFMANDLISTFNAIGAKGNNFRNFVKAGTWTKQVYAGYSPTTIPLKFRIYNRDTLGQSSVMAWKNALRDYAAIAESSVFSSNVASENIMGAVENAYNSGQTTANIANSFVNLFNNKNITNTVGNTGDRNDDEFSTKGAKILKAIQQVNTILNSITNVGESYKMTISVSCLTKSDDYTEIVFSASLSQVKTWMPNEVKIENKKVGVAYAKTDDGRVDPSKLIFEYSDLENAINEFKNKCKGDLKTIVENTFTDSFLEKIKTKMEEPLSSITNEELEMSRTVESFKTMADELGNMLVDKYGPNRVYESMNRENRLGAKLWHLNIFNNVIFNPARPLVVYISKWSYKPSEEMDGNNPVYYDFDIECAMDQVYSRNTWFDILNTNHATNFLDEEEL